MVEAAFVFGGVGWSHPGFDTIEGGIGALGPGDHGGVFGWHVVGAEGDDDIIGVAAFAEDHGVFLQSHVHAVG